MTESQNALTPKQRRQRNHAEMIANILQAAREVMREQGVADLNLQLIARKLGMRAASLYNYFPSKAAIYDALFVLGMRQFREQVEVQYTAHGPTWDGLQVFMECYLRFALENPDLYQLMFERPVPGFTPSEEGLAESQKLLTVANQISAQLIEVGTLRPPVSAEVMTNLIIALMHGLTAQHLANEPDLLLGSGRFGSLIPTVMALLQSAWAEPSQPPTWPQDEE